MTEPMLASPSSVIAPSPAEALGALARTGQWAFELKLDGIRCVATVRDGAPTLMSRLGNDMTYRWPEIVAALVAADLDDMTLDGEIIVCGPDGRPDFPAVHRRDAQGSAVTASRAAKVTPAMLMVFDLPEVTQPYAWRRQALEQLSDQLRGPRLGVVDTYDQGEKVWEFVLEHDLEGLIAKRKTSPYRTGRSSDWVKLKPRRRLSALVSGIVAGDGRRSDSFGALELSLLGAENELVHIGRVGTGFSAADLRHIAAAVRKGALVVDVDYMELSPNGMLRHPVFVGCRNDVSVLDCTLERQLHQ